jgi:hypothetical protein
MRAGLIAFLMIAAAFVVFAHRVSRPVQHEPVRYKPLRKIHAICRARRDSATLSVETNRHAIHRPRSNECIKIIRGFRSASVL